MSAGALPQTPLGKLTVLPKYHSCIYRPTSKEKRVKEKGKRLRGVREGGKAKEGKKRGRKEGREREFGPPTSQMLPPPMAGV